MKRQISLFLSVALLLGATATSAEAAESDAPRFQKVNVYSDGQFTDVLPGSWYNASIGEVYELGLMYGESAHHFGTDQQISVAEAIVLAARLNRIYYFGSGEFEPGENWYEPYVSYAKAAGIVSGEPDLAVTATRAQFADILSRTLPQTEFEPINEIGADAIPDVKSGDMYAESVYLLYRAGIVGGGNARGAFYPDNSISRAEAAAIIARMVDKSLRQSFTLKYVGPDLAALKWRDDAFFAHSAILGNSLVEGLRMYSNMRSLDYFSATSVSVISATKTRDTRLNNGSTGTLVQALCQKQYDKIYIELGINEMYYNTDHFIALYGGMIDSIKEAEPEADIYIVSIFPVTKHKSETDPVHNMTRVNLYNEALYRLAEEKQCYYMDLCSVLQGEDGYLPDRWSSDGVHPYAQYYALWENCMRTMY